MLLPDSISLVRREGRRRLCRDRSCLVAMRVRCLDKRPTTAADSCETTDQQGESTRGCELQVQHGPAEEMKQRGRTGKRGLTEHRVRVRDSGNKVQNQLKR